MRRRGEFGGSFGSAFDYWGRPMFIEPAFRSLLVNNPEVAGFVADRVYLGNRPQDERRPGVVITLAGSEPGHTHDGPDGTSSGTVRLDVLAPTYQGAKQLTDAVREAIDGYSGTVEGVNVGLIEVESEEDIDAAPLEGRASPTFGVSVDAFFLVTQ